MCCCCSSFHGQARISHFALFFLVSLCIYRRQRIEKDSSISSLWQSSCVKEGTQGRTAFINDTHGENPFLSSFESVFIKIL